MKSSPLAFSILVVVLAYLAGFGWIRSQCYGTLGPVASGPTILVPPGWYEGGFLDGGLAYIYWPMFALEEKITGERICGVCTRPPQR